MNCAFLYNDLGWVVPIVLAAMGLPFLVARYIYSERIEILRTENGNLNASYRDLESRLKETLIIVDPDLEKHNKALLGERRRLEAQILQTASELTTLEEKKKTVQPNFNKPISKQYELQKGAGCEVVPGKHSIGVVNVRQNSVEVNIDGEIHDWHGGDGKSYTYNGINYRVILTEMNYFHGFAKFLITANSE